MNEIDKATLDRVCGGDWYDSVFYGQDFAKGYSYGRQQLVPHAGPIDRWMGRDMTSGLSAGYHAGYDDHAHDRPDNAIAAYRRVQKYPGIAQGRPPF